MVSATRLLSLFFSTFLTRLTYVSGYTPNSDNIDMITQSVAAFLQPHTSSPSMPVVARAMCCLMTGDFSGEDFDKVLNAQLDSLAISPQAKQSIIPALLGIAKLAKVQSQRYVRVVLSLGKCLSSLRLSTSTPTSTSLSPSSVPRPKPVDTTAGPSYQMRQRSFSSNSGSGHTTWYFAKSNSSILIPPTIPQAKTGHLYVHLDTTSNVSSYWMLNIANQWERVSSGVESPLNHDRVLAIRANREPSWITRASTITIKTRKEKEFREKSVQG